MSTKVYDAYKVKGTILELMELLRKTRILHTEFIIQIYKRFGGTFKAENYKGILEKDETIQSLADIPYFGDYILEKIIREEIAKGINTPINVGASAVVYFHKKDFYVIFFGLPREIMKIMNHSPILEDYHYQNSADQSNYDWDKEKWEEMTPQRRRALTRDWNQRRKIWDEIIGDGPFYENGLTFDFVPSGYSMTLICQQILGKKDFIPDL